MDRAYEGDETRAFAEGLGYTPVVPPSAIEKILEAMISSCTNSVIRLRDFSVASKGFAAFLLVTINLTLFF